MIRYATFGEDALRDLAAPTAAQIAARYQRDQAQYQAQESRTFTQVVVPSEAAAQKIIQAVRGGATLEAAAGAQGLTTAQVGPISRSDLASQASGSVAEAAFAAARGELAAPARGALGWYVLKADEVETHPARSLAQVHGEIAQALATEQRAAALGDVTAKIDEELEGGKSLADVTGELGLKIEQTPPLTAAGQVYGSQESGPSVLAPVLKTAFEMSEAQPQLAVLEPGKQFLVYDVGEVTPSATAPLAEIRDQVAAGWRLDRGFAGAGEASQRIAARAAKGQPLAAAIMAETVSLPPVDTIDLSRQQIAQTGHVPPPLALMFSMAEGTVKRLAAQNELGWFVVSLDDIVTPELAADDPLVTATVGQLGDVQGDELVEQFVKAVEGHVGIKRDPKAVDAMIAQLTGQGQGN